VAKILSQDEIDALLTTVSGGQQEEDASSSMPSIQEKSVVTYGFKRSGQDAGKYAR